MNEIFQSSIRFLQDLLPPEVSPPVIIFGLTLVACLFFFLYILTRCSLANAQKQLAALDRAAAETAKEISYRSIREAKLITLLKNERKHGADKLKLLEEAREELRLQFADLAGRIFDEKSARFSELNRDKLDTILRPFTHQLDTLKQEINEIYRNDNRERLSLKNEILHLRELNQQVTEEANNLTCALKGDTKMQGNWGELVLEKVLERSGLRRGIEYETQGGFRNHDNRLLKPDVIVHLPDGKDVIIDSKVSLISWERYVNAEEERYREKHLRALHSAIYNHLISLSKKNYPGLHGIKTLDFVLMFMPIEAAFSTAFGYDDELFAKALNHNVIVVTPTTLLATLRTIENIWHFERQSKNSLEIARRAGIMYDKFRSFVEDMEKIGKQLATCHGSYDTALLKLTQGRGNLIAQAEQLKELGVQVKKEMPKSVMEISDLELKN
ncbi:MAG: DNA recombination protein RmuC [Desulforhopalus sp.]